MSLDVRVLAIRELVHDGEFIEAARLQTMWQREDFSGIDSALLPDRYWHLSDEEALRLRRLASFRALPWYRRAWLTLNGRAPR